MFDKPADDNGRRSCSAGFAVDINTLVLFGFLVKKLDPLLYRLERGWIEIDGREPELLDIVLLVSFFGSWVFLAHIDDATDLEFGELGDIPLEGQSPEDDIGVDRVPPVPSMQEACLEIVPGKGR
jgi:hypothetical protein